MVPLESHYPLDNLYFRRRFSEIEVGYDLDNGREASWGQVLQSYIIYEILSSWPVLSDWSIPVHSIM